METSDIDYAIDSNDILPLDTIRQYRNTTVYKALWRQTIVCVKAIRDEPITNELRVLSKCIHPKITQFLGAAKTDNCTMMLTEYMSMGNLRECIVYRRLDTSRKHQIVIDILLGLHYLHSRKPMHVLHRDLKPENILINETTAKICDFGVSKLTLHKTESERQIHTGETGTYLWTAPEALTSLDYDEKIDMYSFGLLLYYIYFERIPFETMQPIQIAYGKMKGDLTLEIPDCPWKKLIQSCISYNPEDRPSAQQALFQIV